MIGRSGDAVCDPHHTRGEDEERKFSGLASKLVTMVCQLFGIKTTVIVSWFGPQNQGRRFGDLSFKITVTVSWFVPQNHSQWFGDLSLKIITIVSWFGPQIQVGRGLCLKIYGWMKTV
jgi:hypothetical protein